jgi:hypothetical protein
VIALHEYFGEFLCEEICRNTLAWSGAGDAVIKCQYLGKLLSLQWHGAASGRLPGYHAIGFVVLKLVLPALGLDVGVNNYPYRHTTPLVVKLKV